MFADDFDRLLEPYAPPVAKLARKLHDEVMAIQPDYTRKVSFGWQTVNFTLPKRGFINALYMENATDIGPSSPVQSFHLCNESHAADSASSFGSERVRPA